MYIFRLTQLATLLMLSFILGLILGVILVLLLLILCLHCLGDAINEIFGDFQIRAPVEHDGKGSIDHDY